MNRKTFKSISILILISSDAMMIVLSFLSAYWIRFFSPLKPIIDRVIGDRFTPPPIDPYFNALPFITFIWLAVFVGLGLYRSKRGAARIEELYYVVKATILSMLILVAAGFWYRGFSYSRSITFISMITGIFYLGLSRLIIREIKSLLLSKGFGTMRVLIVGVGEAGRIVSQQIKTKPELGFEVVGYIDDERQDRGNYMNGYRMLGSTEEVLAIIEAEKVDDLIIALSPHDHDKILKILLDCSQAKIRFRLIPDLFELITSRVRIGELSGIPMMTLREEPLEGYSAWVKRWFDIIFSALALLVVSPLMLFISLVLKLSSQGPIFFRQERVSRDGKLFNMYKFRSMKTDAEDKSGPVWAAADDPRTTLLGKFLRKTSLDELPQLMNVLNGDMSLVGPRPERPFFVDRFKGTIPRYMERHKVKTGITGWAQVNGLRGNTSLEERVKYDLYYIENWSLLFDLKILVKTIPEVFRPKNTT